MVGEVNILILKTQNYYCAKPIMILPFLDPFVRELTLKGLRESEISKLISKLRISDFLHATLSFTFNTCAENGIETIEDLESIEEEDLKSFGFNFGEKKRLRNLLSSLVCKSSPGILFETYCPVNLYNCGFV